MGSLISVLLLICLVVGKRIRDRCDSASYPVKELEKRQRECGTPRTTIFINPGQLAVNSVWSMHKLLALLRPLCLSVTTAPGSGLEDSSLPKYIDTFLLPLGFCIERWSSL